MLILNTWDVGEMIFHELFCSYRMDGAPAPDCFFIDQAKATLLQLMTSQLIKHCELRYLHVQSGVVYLCVGGLLIMSSL